jgi:hypothetical protein
VFRVCNQHTTTLTSQRLLLVLMFALALALTAACPQAIGQYFCFLACRAKRLEDFMMPKHFDDPAYLRERARQTRATADLVADLTERERLLRTAAHYERLADLGELRSADRKAEG